MTDDIKVFTPEEIDDLPFPQEDGGSFNTTQSSSGGVFKPTTTKENSMPTKRIAVELLSTALNTRSKKILGEFQFTEMGALQIGKYVNGVSGDLRISPNGIVARNISGITTFALDGDTGDAIFAGELQAGSFVTGDIVIREGGKITLADDSNTTVIDAEGLLSSNSFISDSKEASPSFTTTSLTYVDVTGATLAAFTLTRQTNISVFLIVIARNATFHSDINNTMNIKLTDGTTTYLQLLISGIVNGANTQYQMVSQTLIGSVPAGTYNFKLQCKANNGGTADLFWYIFGYTKLGN